MKISNSLTKLIFLCLLVLCRMATAQQGELKQYQMDNPDAKCSTNLSNEIPGDIYCVVIKKGFFGSPTGEKIESYYLNGLLDTAVHTHVKEAILPWWINLQGARTPNLTSKGERKVTGDGLAAFYLFTVPPDSETITFVFSQNTAYRNVLDGKLELVDSDSVGTQNSESINKPKLLPVKDDEHWFDPLKEEREQAYVEEQRKSAPDTWRATLKELSKNDFCVSYGEFIKGESLDSNGYLSEDVALKLVKAEARRRKLTFNDKQIQNEEIRIGMTECQLYATWGFPHDQNRTVGSWGVHIQHIYGSTYIYTENGRVTSWQD